MPRPSSISIFLRLSTCFLTREPVPAMKAANHCNLQNEKKSCRVYGTYIWNLTVSSWVLMFEISVSILVSVSRIFNSWTLDSSRIRPFSRLRSSRTFAWVFAISSFNLCLSFSRSEVIRSWSDLTRLWSFFSSVCNSDRNFAKSTFCVYVVFSWSSLETSVRLRPSTLIYLGMIKFYSACLPLPNNICQSAHDRLRLRRRETFRFELLNEL